MARTGFYDPKPLLDLDMKERRSSAQSIDVITVAFHEDGATRSIGERFQSWGQCLPWVCARDHSEANGSAEEPVVFYPQGLQGLHSLQALVPTLLRHEMEVALEKLGLIWDRTYAWDMFLEMMRNQAQHCFPNADLPVHFTDATRAILVDWIIQIHVLMLGNVRFIPTNMMACHKPFMFLTKVVQQNVFLKPFEEIMSFQEETLYLAIHLLNRSLRLIKVTTTNLQLLGMVCLFLAAKKEECLLPEVSVLCYLMDHTYTKHQLLRMERKVLCGLKFNLSHCPPLHFLSLLATVARCSAMMLWMARYLLELSLLEGQCVAFSPLQMAGASLCLARLVLQEPTTPEGDAAWCLAFSVHCGSEASLLKIMQILASAAAKAHTQETCATFMKYSSITTMHVSRHPGLIDASNLLQKRP